MNDITKGTLTGDPIEAPVEVTPPKTRDERIADWKNENKAAYSAARDRCCMCAPSRADMLLVEQMEGRANIPVD